MTSDDAFGERFLEAFDGIALMQSAERQRRHERASAHLVDRVTVRATGAHEDEPRCAAGDSASSPLASDGNKAEMVALAARMVRNAFRLVGRRVVRSVRGMRVAIFARG